MSLITQNPTIDLATEQQPSIYYLDDGVAVFKTIGDPAGVVAANPGSLAVDASGNVYRKTSTGAAGWINVVNEPIVLPGIVGDFSQVNPGGASFSNEDNAIVIRAPASAGDNMRILDRAYPTTPCTITLGFVPTFFLTNFFHTGLCMRESGTGRIVTCGHGNSGATFIANNIKFNSPTSFNSDYVTPLSYAQTSSLLWVRFTDDGVTRRTWFSNDGKNFIQFTAVGRTDFLTPDRIGFYVNTNNATYESVAKFYSFSIT